MSSTKLTHIAVVPFAAWGHLRPLIHLSSNLLIRNPNLHISLLLAPSVFSRVEKELESDDLKQLHLNSKDNANNNINPAINRIQLIHVKSADKKLPEVWDVNEMVQENIDYATIFPDFIIPLLKGGKPLPGDGIVENTFNAIPVSGIIYDFFQIFVPSTMEAVFNKLKVDPVPLINFCGTNAAAFYAHLSEKGWLNRTLELSKDEIEAGGKPEEVYAKYIAPSEGLVFEIPGLATKYDYEWRPHLGAFPMPPGPAFQLLQAYQMKNHPLIKAYLLPTVQELEIEVHAAIDSEITPKVIMAGIQFPEDSWRGIQSKPTFTNPDDIRIMNFLDRMGEKHGNNSVLYISLGSVFFPVLRPELLSYMIESLLEHEVPFVFAHASPAAGVLSSELFDKIKSSDNSESVGFAPQWAVVNHPATGFFLSHCGSNGVAEGIMAGLPMVCMPFVADQGEFAEMLVNKYKVALPIYQTYTPKPLPALPKSPLKLYNGVEVIGTEEAIKAEFGEIWTKLRGAEGEILRKNMKELKALVKKSWESGKSKAGMEELVAMF